MKYHLVRNQRPIKYKEFIQQIQNSSRSSLNEPSILSQRSYRESGGNNRSSKMGGNVENKNIFIDDSNSPQQKKVDDDGEQYKQKEFKATHKLTEQQQQQQQQQQINNNDNNSNPTLSLQQNNNNNTDKLYTFCDAKLTQRSVETANKQNHPPNHQNNHRNQLLSNAKSNTNNNIKQLKLQEGYHMQKVHSEMKYFRTNKQKSQQKENINFVNSILAKVENIHQNKHKQRENLGKGGQHQEGSFLKVKENYQPLLNHITCEQLQSNSLHSSQQNTQRKIQNVRKVRVKQSVTQTSQKANNVTNNQSNQKLRQQSLTHIKGKQSHPSQETGHKQVLQSREKERNPSSKKKIVALNINSKKTNNIIQNNNKIKLKLTMEPSSEKERIYQPSGGSQNKPKLREQQNSSIIEGKNILYGSLVSQNARMKSLQQSKIQVTNNDLSNHNLLMSGSSLTDLANLLTKQASYSHNAEPNNEQIQRLQSVINNHIERQNQFSRQINELNQRLKNFKNIDDKKQLQILQKDCYRLTTSYKEIKRLYQIQVESKEQIEAKYKSLLMEISTLKQQLKVLKISSESMRQQNIHLNQTTKSLRSENTDLKQCLKYKQTVMKDIQSKMIKLTKHNRQLQQQLARQHYPPQLQGLSEMIKEKISQYEESIENYIREVDQYREENMQLQEENENLMMIRQKLENFTNLLKEEIDDKDALIEDYESQLRQLSHLRKSIKNDNQHNEFTETKLRLKIKQLQSKLKLANSHIEYLTKQIIDFKHERQLKQGQQNNMNNNRLENKYQTVKSTNITTIGNSLTTRYSSITHFDTMNSCYPYQEMIDGGNNNVKVGARDACREEQYREINTQEN